MRIKFALVISMGLMTFKAFAGVEHGNGGGVIVCQDNRKMELLDFYEQRQLFKLNLDLGFGAETDYKKIAKYWLAKHADIATFRQALWGKFVDEFESEVEWLDGVTLGETSDLGGAIIPAGCKFELAVIQETPSEIRPKMFYVNRDIWQKLAPEQRAGLVLHEAIYREAMMYGHDNSKVTRYFVAIWTSQGVHKDLKSKDSINALLQRNRFLAGDLDGCSPAVYSYKKFPNGSLQIDWDSPRPTYSRSDVRFNAGSNVFSDLVPVTLKSISGLMSAECSSSSYHYGEMIYSSVRPISGTFATEFYRASVAPDVPIHNSRLEIMKHQPWGDDEVTRVAVQWPVLLQATIQGQTIDVITSIAISETSNHFRQLQGAKKFNNLIGLFNKRYSSSGGGAHIVTFTKDGLVESCTGCAVD